MKINTINIKLNNNVGSFHLPKIKTVEKTNSQKLFQPSFWGRDLVVCNRKDISSQVILNKQQRETTIQQHSVSNWSDVIEKSLKITREQSKQFAQQIASVAQMPQEAFDNLAIEVQLLEERGYKIDSINPNNLIVDVQKNQLRIMDSVETVDVATNSNKNTCFDIIAMMCDFVLFPELFDNMNEEEKQATIKAARIIADKVHDGAQKAGLSCNLAPYISYINDSLKNPQILNVFYEETQRQYNRAFDVRMNDFLSMMTFPARWAENR